MKKNYLSMAVVLCLIVSMFVSATQSSAATISISANFKTGRVTDITKSKVVYRTQTGSEPETWARPKTLKIVSSTRFYKCTGYNSSYTKYKLKKISKAKAIKAVYNNGDNYVFFVTNGKKVKKLIYGMENYVG